MAPFARRRAPIYVSAAFCGQFDLGADDLRLLSCGCWLPPLFFSRTWVLTTVRPTLSIDAQRHQGRNLRIRPCAESCPRPALAFAPHASFQASPLTRTRSPESSFVSLLAARLALNTTGSAAAARDHQQQRAPKAPPEGHTGTSPIRHRRDDVAATARSDHDHPRRREAQQETAN